MGKQGLPGEQGAPGRQGDDGPMGEQGNFNFIKQKLFHIETMWNSYNLGFQYGASKV